MRVNFSYTWAEHRAFVPRSRAERLIAAGRLVLAAFSLLTITLDPLLPGKHATEAYTLLAGYLLYSVLILVAVWRWETVLGWMGITTHVFDLAVFCVFLYLTEGPTSPSFIYFVFSLVSATLRWQWRGVVYTAAAVLTIFMGSGLYAARVLHDPSFELNRFLMRSVYLAVSAALLAYLGAYETRLWGEIYRLSKWPVQISRDLEEVIKGLLENAANVVGVRKVWLVWEEEEEPWVSAAWLDETGFGHEPNQPWVFEGLLAPELTGCAFLCLNLDASRPLVLSATGRRLRYRRGQPLDPALQAKLNCASVLSAPVRAKELQARLFFLDKSGMTSDDLALADVVAQRVADAIRRFRLLGQLRQSIAADERLRLAGDLHDGVLQSLTASAVQLQTARQLLQKDSGAADERLAEVQAILASEQRELRFFVDELRPSPLHTSAPATLEDRIKEMGERLHRQWGLRVETTVDLEGREMPESATMTAYRIVQEALMNAAKHAAATLARVDVAVDGHQLRITVADNGRGFAFHGHFEHEQLVERKLGPVILKERVAVAGGSLAIDSGESGSCLTIRLPLVKAKGAYAD